LYWANFQHVR